MLLDRLAASAVWHGWASGLCLGFSHQQLGIMLFGLYKKCCAAYAKETEKGKHPVSITMKSPLCSGPYNATSGNVGMGNMMMIWQRWRQQVQGPGCYVRIHVHQQHARDAVAQHLLVVGSLGMAVFRQHAVQDRACGLIKY